MPLCLSRARSTGLIIVAILLAKGVRRDTELEKALGHEVFLGKSIMLLLGGLITVCLAAKEANRAAGPLYTSMLNRYWRFLAGDGSDSLPRQSGQCLRHYRYTLVASLALISAGLVQ